MKLVVKIAVALLAVCIVMLGGCRLMIQYITSCKTCEQFNIDNFELRTSTDIKNGNAIWCRYDGKTGTKTVKFQMDIPASGFKRYIEWSCLNKTDSGLKFTVIPSWNDTLNALNHSLYYKQGSNSKDSWRMVLDSNTTTLWAELIESK